MNSEDALYNMYSVGDFEVECIASKGRDIVDCCPSKWTSLNGAEVDIVDKRCIRVGSLFRRHCGCR